MRLIGFIGFALAGLAVLLSLGVWQVQRLAWKEAILAEIEARIVDAPVALPAEPGVARDRYLPVRVDGRLMAPELHVLISTAELGPSYRVIAPFETDGRRIMVDLGAIPVAAKDIARVPGRAEILGNLHWPDEVDGFTPAPDLSANIWFAREVPQMADALDAEPILIVAREIIPTVADVTPLLVGTDGIPNDHLNYAITWFSLATIWAGMTGVFVWRMAKRQS